MKKSEDDFQKPQGIREIAEALGISIGTVDRALHNRKGVSPKTRAEVLDMAEKLQYSPNIAARNLKLRRQLKIGVYLPREIASYYDALRSGIRSAVSSESSATIDVQFFDYPRLGEGVANAMEKSRWERHDGIILAPGYPSQMARISQKAKELALPIVCVTTDAPYMHRVCSISADSFVSGGIAAELLGGLVSTPGDVVLFTGDLKIQDHSDKLKGFAAALATYSKHLRLLPVIEAHDSYEIAYEAMKRTLADSKDLVGVYVNTANCLPVLHAMKRSKRATSVRVITTDLFPELVSAIEAGEVSASLYQRPFTQGKLAVEALAALLARGISPKPQLKLAPHLILRSNLGLFRES